MPNPALLKSKSEIDREWKETTKGEEQNENSPVNRKKLSFVTHSNIPRSIVSALRLNWQEACFHLENLEEINSNMISNLVIGQVNNIHRIFQARKDNNNISILHPRDPSQHRRT